MDLLGPNIETSHESSLWVKKNEKKRELFVCFERERERERDPFFSTSRGCIGSIIRLYTLVLMPLFYYALRN